MIDYILVYSTKKVLWREPSGKDKSGRALDDWEFILGRDAQNLGKVTPIRGIRRGDNGGWNIRQNARVPLTTHWATAVNREPSHENTDCSIMVSRGRRRAVRTELKDSSYAVELTLSAVSTVIVARFDAL